MASEENDLFISFVVGGTEIWALKSTFTENSRGRASRIAKLLPVFGTKEYQSPLPNTIDHPHSVTPIFFDQATAHPRPDLVAAVYHFEDHDPAVFQDILYYIQTGRLHTSSAVCPEFFKEEMKFWGIRCDSESQSCLCAKEVVSYPPMLGASVRSKRLDCPVADVDLCDRDISWKRKCIYIRNRLWLTIENQEFTSFGLFLFVVSNLVISVNILIIIMDSLPQNHWSDLVDGLGRYINLTESQSSDIESTFTSTTVAFSTPPQSIISTNSSTSASSTSHPSQTYSSSSTLTFQQAYQYWSVDWLCNAWFTIEILLRLLSAPTPKALFCDMMFIIDVLAVVPSYISLIVAAASSSGGGLAKVNQIFKLLRIVRALRVVRVLKLARLDQSFRILPVVFKKLLPDFMVFMALLSVTTLILATSLYYIEEGAAGTHYVNIPVGVFWAVASTYTFSDCPPVSPFGKVISSIGAIIGVVVMALPIVFIIKGFADAFKTFRKEQLEEMKKKKLENQLLANIR